MAATLMPAAQAAPALPARTPAQLLAAVAAQSRVPAFSGTVLEATSLGLPQLPGTQSPTSIISLLTGSHTIQVWYASPRQYRLALPGSMSETDLYRSGSTGWLWQSVPDTVTKFTLPAHQAAEPAQAEPAPAEPALTPQQAANQVLAAVGPTTTVSVDSNVYVAGQPAYELDLAPKDARSLVGQVRIAIDAHNNVPLRVQVFARHATSPAISVGFTSVRFAAPAASDLTFTPPRGAKVTTVNPPADHGTGSINSTGISTTGSGWLTVFKLPSSLLTEATSGGTPGASNAPISVNGGPGDSAAALQALLGAATAVHGTWGSGQLLRTSLISVLITNGTMYVGAVQPSVLYAAAAHH
jgi:outer membrane lipoprotein-sorting protein